MTARKRYAAVEIGGRIPMFVDPIAGKYRAEAELAGLSDTSVTRMQFHQRRLTEEFQCPPIPQYQYFDLMLREQSLDCVIVCKPDHLHHHFIIKTHCADYFRRWHSYKALSGGLLLHKSTHHFDMINWWLDGIPEQVFARSSIFFCSHRFPAAQANVCRYCKGLILQEALKAV